MVWHTISNACSKSRLAAMVALLLLRLLATWFVNASSACEVDNCLRNPNCKSLSILSASARPFKNEDVK